MIRSGNIYDDIIEPKFDIIFPQLQNTRKLIWKYIRARERLALDSANQNRSLQMPQPLYPLRDLAAIFGVETSGMSC